MSINTPAWVKDAIFYQIFPDRFAKSKRNPAANLPFEAWDSPPTVHGFKGGDLYGAPEKQLDGRTHLENLFVCGTDQGFVGIIGIGAYVWFRFEFKFGTGAFLTTFHDGQLETRCHDRADGRLDFRGGTNVKATVAKVLSKIK